MHIKKWVHLIFWSLFILPTFIQSLSLVSNYKSIYFYALGVFSYLFVMFLAFYPISEYIAPRLVRNLKNWKMWLLLVSHIAVMALIHMGLEYLIAKHALSNSGSYQPDYMDYFQGMLWFVFLASSVYILLEWYELQLQQTQLRQFLAQTELEKKRFQLNPHFLFNIFNSMYALSIKKSDILPDIILKLSELMRYILDQNHAYNSISDEIKILEHYLQLESMRLGKYCKIYFEKSLDDEQAQIPAMLLLPLVENCFKHGINTLTDANYVSITIRLENKELFFRTENLKWEIQSGSFEKQGKLGIENLRQRLQMLYKPSDYSLEFDDSKKTFIVQLFVNLSLHEMHCHRG